MSQTRAYSPEIKSAAAKLRAEGMTYAEIETALGIRKCTLASWFTRRTFAPLPRPPRQRYQPVRRSAAVVEQVRRMRSEGATLESISAALGVPTSTVGDWTRSQEFTPSRADRRCEGGA